MASIDRYRPARESYQPPVLPSSAPRQERRPSRSPARRRDVPPPAPSPPAHTSRTSPPRPHSRRSAQSPAQSTPQTPSPAAIAPNQWYFTPDEVLSTPSILDGLPPAEERLRRAKGVNFIYQAGVLLDLPQITLWVASVFFHRFYMRYSMVEEKNGVHHYNIAATSLFLANKTEENCRKTKDIIIAVARVAQKNAKLVIDEQSKEYWRWRDSILMYEELMLELLTFDLMVDNPFQRLFDLLGQLEIAHNKELRQSAWAFCCDACTTTLPLLMEARDIAVTAIFFASAHKGQQIDDVNGTPWWKFLNGDEDRCASAIDVMRQFYTENPLRKPTMTLPSPPFRLENTRRRGEAILSQGTTPPPVNTPMDVDRATQSPRAKANGAGEMDVDGTERGNNDVMGSGSQMQREDRPYGNGSPAPGKRKDADSEGDVLSGRNPKRNRQSEEGESETAGA